VARHTTHNFFAVPRSSGRVHICFSASRDPHEAWHAHVTCPRHAGEGTEMVEHRGRANQRVPVLETDCIPLEHTERTLLILGRMISIEERVPESRLLGLPSFKLKLRTRRRFVPSAPFNARCDGSDLIRHRSPSLRDRPRRPLISGTPSVTSHKGCQWIDAACPVPSVLVVPISCRVLKARSGNDDRLLEKGHVGEYVGLRIHPRQPIRLDRKGDHDAINPPRPIEDQPFFPIRSFKDFVVGGAVLKLISEEFALGVVPIDEENRSSRKVGIRRHIRILRFMRGAN